MNGHLPWNSEVIFKPYVRGNIMKQKGERFFISLLIIIIFLFPVQAVGGEGVSLSTGQTLYVPAYSHIYSGNKEIPYLLTVTLSIRNTDFNHPIVIKRVDYYETKGLLLKKYLDKEIFLKPMESTRFIVPQKEKQGGAGANFLVEWDSKNPVNTPIVESVMIGTQSQQGISFTSRGKEILVPKSH